MFEHTEHFKHLLWNPKKKKEISKAEDFYGRVGKAWKTGKFTRIRRRNLVKKKEK